MLTADAHSALRALVVEDDPGLRETLIEELTRIGFDAHGVGSTEEALRWIDEHGPPSVVSTDLGLPILSGFRLCEELRRRGDMLGVPIAVVSGRVDVADHAHAMEVGADAFIEKPRGLRRYVDTIRGLVVDRADARSAWASS